MAQLNGNNAYLSWDGTVFNTFWAGEISNEMTSDGEDTTHGSGSTHIQRQSKLIDTSMSIYIIHDDTLLDSYKAKLQPGLIGTLIWGPESNVAGKPKFQGSMRLASVGTAQSIEKTKVGYDLSFEQADTPTSTLTGTLAGVFS